jgi:hypothetical protein
MLISDDRPFKGQRYITRVGDKRPASPRDILDLTLVNENNVNEIKQLEILPFELVSIPVYRSFS